jgi:hypothetical protein
MRVVLASALVALTLAPAALAKGGDSVLVLGPSSRALVAPWAPVHAAIPDGGPLAPPREPYVLLYPLMRNGVPMRPGRWYPRSRVVCTGWRTGVEAGCVRAQQLRPWLGRGTATGVFRVEPARILTLTRNGVSLLPYGNEATAIKLSLGQRAKAAAAPSDCVSFAVRWSGPPGRPTSLCVSPKGGVYAAGLVYPLPATAALFLIG